MKKLLSIAAAACISITLIACGGGLSAEKKEEAVQEAVNGFLSAITEGDFEKIKSYANEDVQQTLADVIAPYDDAFSKLDLYITDEATKEKLNTIGQIVIKSVFENSEITETEKLSNNQFAVVVKNKGVNLESLSQFDVEQLQSIVDTESFIEEKQDEIVEKFVNDGRDAAVEWLMPQYIDFIIESFNKYIAGQKREENNKKFIIDKEGENWIITDIQ